ncbi:cupin [Candidatus Acidianus copahuensis]|uniref:Cupin n=1 Tax=Candidatus Acidianus copahuensis TaxID=1160895 RepID=A0A031LY09_9CREN|nr:cupin domain-containing protein [Candidatus Acidianus copahuensis]EZQ12038.1 cupin [Candidatus Acidianus copahuensis]
MDYHISNISKVDRGEVQIKGSKGSYIQWLITREHGAEYAVRKFTLDPKGIIPMHTHKYQETVIITKGKCKVCVGDKVFNLKEGDYIFINSQVKHAILNEEESLEFFCIINYTDDMSIKPLDEDCTSRLP